MPPHPSDLDSKYGESYGSGPLRPPIDLIDGGSSGERRRFWDVLPYDDGDLI